METGKTNEGANDERLKEFQDALIKMQQQVEELSKNKNLPNADGQKLMDGAGIEKLIEAIDRRKEVIDVRTYVREAEIDHDDHDVKGAIFFTYSVGYAIVDDIRSGRPIRTPYGNVIFFQYQATRKTKMGRHQEVSTYSAYVSHSKKEQEWLRKHRHYNVRFFETAASAMKVDARRAMRLASHITALEQMDQSSIIRKCREKQVPVTDSLREMVTNLAYVYAEDDMRNEANATKDLILETVQEGLKIMH